VRNRGRRCPPEVPVPSQGPGTIERTRLTSFAASQKGKKIGKKIYKILRYPNETDDHEDRPRSKKGVAVVALQWITAARSSHETNFLTLFTLRILQARLSIESWFRTAERDDYIRKLDRLPPVISDSPPLSPGLIVPLFYPQFMHTTLTTPAPDSSR
jgi:hypothetical protein